MIVFNILPIYPLDGYRIIECILKHIYDETYSNDILMLISSILMMLLIIVLVISRSVGLIIVYLFLVYKQIIHFKTLRDKDHLIEYLNANYFYFYTK